MKRFSFVLLAIFMLAACTMNTEEGILVVSNDSELDTEVITSVLVKEKESSGFTAVYIGEILTGKSYLITLKPGDYQVMVQVKKSALNGLLEETDTYETGYKDFRPITASKSLYVSYDGIGLFFE